MKPDFTVIDKAVRNGIPDRVPLYEHFVDGEVISEIMGWEQPASSFEEYWKRLIQFYSQMGYDYLPLELGPKFVSRNGIVGEDTAIYNRGNRTWVDEHSGPISCRRDMEEAYWPSPDDAFDYATFELVAKLLPPGMKVIGGASGGPFEHASFLMGLEGLSIAIHEDPEFIGEFFSRIGETLVAVAERLAPLECIGVYRFGDDLGYKSSTMLSPAHLRKYVFPWQKKVVEAVHKAGKPFLLHSCGNLEAVMDDIIDDVGVDAKHSFEDVIMPVTEAKKRWGDRIAILGGVDVDFLARSTPKAVREYSLRILDGCAPGGGYAFGSGNTIANYVPVDNYLSMLDAWHTFNGI